MGGAIGRGESTLSELQRQNADLRRQLDQAMSDYKNLDQRIATLSIGPLDSDTARALQGLEDQFPNMISFDEARGMLRVASDLTFDSGSDVVKDSARQALSALSNVLKSGSATQYTIVVEGHTDSQVISNPATKQNHKTNRHLSAHRAIGVINTLAGMGVDSSRMMAAGWGEHRPAVPNNANGNTAANRRVELYLARTNGTTAQAPAGVQKATPNTPAPRQPAYDVTK
jgi:chemotaxis protein MotB